ncbi:Stp1/IreP family PP2C-type Ser/Thr phosphatase [Lentilactobacillus sp. Marseille-Q4993]|uniref:Stp1/IreP family PP2C-type Ser/Thr phosphatase n=1 Tax=Lentilactobacillus sp. Marseille-Q4993 TaxID=3039492 RepID=UPI0024BBEB92|nr:Stp1/IreP family PP2C-type Ser/Thr phosphatase [Lentilactobacillus sp. Marseille-Q4993]
MKSAYKSSIGMVRDKNEDAVGTFKNQQGVILALITDGIGGNKGGEVASQFVVSKIGQVFKKTDIADSGTLKKWLEQILTEVNNDIINESNSDLNLKGMGTTFVAALIAQDKSLISNIGDSRGYLYRDGELVQLSEDHSYVNELVKSGDITPDEAKHNPYKNIITKSLGINDVSTADFREFDFQPNNQILLCSDGLTNMVDEDVIKGVLAKDIDVKEKCQQLIDLANQNGGLDNVTVLILDNDSEGDPDE